MVIEHNHSLQKGIMHHHGLGEFLLLKWTCYFTQNGGQDWCDSYRKSNDFIFHRNRESNLKVIWQSLRSPDRKSDLSESKQSWKLLTAWVKIYNDSIAAKTIDTGRQKRVQSPGTNPHIFSPLPIKQMSVSNTHAGKSKFFSKWCQKNCKSTCRKNVLYPTLYSIETLTRNVVKT